MAASVAQKTFIADGEVVSDGSWVLRILVTDMNVERHFRVRGDMHIGGVMLRLVEELAATRDWSDHALWWPKRNRWLLHTRSTLDQNGVGSDSILYFTPMHKMARVQLPDLQFIDCRLDFSIPSFNACVQLCKELGIRYPEELSFKRFTDPDTLRKAPSDRRESIGSLKKERSGREGSAGPQQQHPSSKSAYDISSPSRAPSAIDGSMHNLNGAGAQQGSYGHNTSTWPYRGAPSSIQFSTLQNGASTETLGRVTSPVANVNVTWDGIQSEIEQTLTNSPRNVPPDVVDMMIRPKNFAQKANLNRGWLDSSISLMEQNINDNDLLLLRFKFLKFFDLSTKYDQIRINQIYEQGKWSLLMEEIDCTEEEMFLFAALQLQVVLQLTMPQTNGAGKANTEDDVEHALDELECQLEGVTLSKYSDITSVPELSDYLKYMKPRKVTLKGWKRCYFTLKDTNVAYYSSASESRGVPQGTISLKGCEVSPDVNLSQGKYGIKLLIPSAEGMADFWLRCDSESQYARWMAACKLASKGKTMADAAYPAEVDNIRRLLDMQHPSPAPISSQVPSDLNPEEFIAQRYLKRFKSRQQIVQKILEAHANVKDLSLIDAKLQYIRAWQALPEHGLHYFAVRLINQSRKPELLAICYNRLTRMNLESGEAIKTWHYNTMTKWHVNWEIKHLLVQFEEENLEFSCLSADCKVPHEFIGGYIFCTMRSKEQNQVLNEELFHKLTSGWS